MLPPDQTGLLYTGTTHGPLVQGGTVRDGPQRLPGHVRPLRGGEHRPGVPGPDQPLHVPGLLGVGRDDDQEGEGDHLKYGDDILSPQSPLSAGVICIFSRELSPSTPTPSQAASQ